MGRGKTKNRTKAKKRSNAVVGEYLRATPERIAHNDTRSMGMATQVVPVIEELFDDRMITAEEYRALGYYRDQASLADRSLVKSNIDFSVKGGGNGPGVSILSANLETGRMERDMGALVHLCRAVCVDDVSLEEWCSRHGSRLSAAKAEENRNPKAALESLMLIELGVPEPDPFDVAIALLELKYAAGGIVVNRR